MIPVSKSLLSFLLAFGLVISPGCHKCRAESIRKPVRAGSFYPADPALLTGMIDRLTHKAGKTPVRIASNKPLKAVIMPHAGYIYSGWTAAHASRVLKKKRFPKVILMGPDHFIGITNGAICDVDAFETPLGEIKLHRDALKLRRHPDLFQALPASRDKEHSLEVILPFLQSYLGEFQLVPVVVGRTDVSRFSDALETIIDRHTLLAVSSDLSHFLTYAEATALDRDTLDGIVNLNPDRLVSSGNRACGVIPIQILMEIARRRHWQPALLHYSNSGDTAGSRSRVVGYAVIAFFGDQPMERQLVSNANFTEEQGRLLVKLARQSIKDKLSRQTGHTGSDPLTIASQDPDFQSLCGTFVTLKIHGQLRGCIGNLTSTETVWDGVKRNAINAAFHDPRFSALTDTELDQTKIEVSILSEPRPLEHQNGRDLVKKLRVNVDGVIIRKGHASATFLPQVWEQLPQPEKFLSHLCMKAGLSSDAWKDPELEVLTYQVQYFEEK